MRRSILITGANGFLGNNILKYLLKRNLNVTGTVRNKSPYRKNANIKIIKETNNYVNWQNYLKNIDVVIHTAGLAGSNNKFSKNWKNLYEINVSNTINLAKEAVKSGVAKFIYLSTAQVHGEISDINKSINVNSPYNPQSDYALSKVEAEKGLNMLRGTSNMDIVILRPPLVYGNGTKSNFSKLIDLIKQEKFLPFKLVKNNKMSFISLDNLNDLIYTCIKSNEIINSNFLLRDPTFVSTSFLIKEIAFAFNCKPKLFPVPIKLLCLLSILFNVRKPVKQLTSNFEIDISFTQKKLNWKPKFSLRNSLLKMKNQLREN